MPALAIALIVLIVLGQVLAGSFASVERRVVCQRSRTPAGIQYWACGEVLTPVKKSGSRE